MRSIFRHYLQHNFITKSILQDIRYYEELSKEYLIEAYSEALIRLYKRVFNYSSFYRALYMKHGLHENSIKNISDIFKLPVITKKEIVSSQNKLNNGFQIFKIKGNTSGTTGTPFTTFRTPLSMATESAYQLHYRESKGLKLGDSLVSLRGVLSKSTLYKFDKWNKILYLSGPNLNQNTISLYIKLINELKPKAIEGFPSYLHKLIMLANANKSHIVSIPLTFTSSEMLYDFQRAAISDKLETTIYDWYGNVERTIALAQDSSCKYKPQPLYSINEFNQNSLITTSLNNYYFPLIRYQIDDVIQVNTSDFIENLINPDVVSIHGRAGDTIELPDGSNVACIDHAFKGIKGLMQAQIHQYKNHKIEIWIKVNSSFTNTQEYILRKNMVRMLGEGLSISFKIVPLNQFVQSSNQKYKLIVKHEKTLNA